MEILKLREHRELAERAAMWFHEKWDIPAQAYRDSIQASITGPDPVPQWYLAMDGQTIAGGLGVIDNDFHCRKDLTPNICAVYVEEPYRCRGIAGALLARACADLHEAGMDVVYLLTSHTGFYERYGWQFHCMVRGDDGETELRMYQHCYSTPH